MIRFSLVTLFIAITTAMLGLLSVQSESLMLGKDFVIISSISFIISLFTGFASTKQKLYPTNKFQLKK